MMAGRDSPNRSGLSDIRGFDAFELRLGDVMRGERATLGKSLIDVQRELKIKATYIAAIENADAAAFDTPGFIAGYVRSYARYLGLDPEWAWEKFCLEAGFEQPHGLSARASSPRPARKTGLEALGDPNASFVPRAESPFAQIELRALGSIAVLVALIGALGYGAWAVVQEVQRVELAPVDRAPGVVASLDGLPRAGAGPGQPADEAVAGVDLIAPAPDAAEALNRLYRPPALDVPILIARDGPIAAVEPGSVGALADARPAVPSATAPAGSAAPADPAAAAAAVAAADPVAPQVVADDAPDLQLLAVRPAWVRVTAADGTVLLEKILEPGERWTIPATEEPPTLRAGNSGAIYFAVAGQTYGPAAPGAQVVKDIALGAAALSQTFALADPATDPDLAAVAVAEAAGAAVEAVSE
jgi:cytoskeletal protein RodZ